MLDSIIQGLFLCVKTLIQGQLQFDSSSCLAVLKLRINWEGEAGMADCKVRNVDDDASTFVDSNRTPLCTR